MPYITTTYSWTVPFENEFPWDASYATGVKAQDLTVFSLENLVKQLGTTTTVISCPPTTGPAISVTLQGSTTMPQADDSYVMSIGTYNGRLAGTYTVPVSGCVVRFELQMAGLNAPNYSVVQAGGPAIMQQLIRLVGRTATSCFNATNGNSAWAFEWRQAAQWSSIRFMCLTSVGPGVHSFELQTRFRTFSLAGTFGTSEWGFGDSHIRLWATLQSR